MKISICLKNTIQSTLHNQHYNPPNICLQNTTQTHYQSPKLIFKAPKMVLPRKYNLNKTLTSLAGLHQSSRERTCRFRLPRDSLSNPGAQGTQQLPSQCTGFSRWRLRTEQRLQPGRDTGPMYDIRKVREFRCSCLHARRALRGQILGRLGLHWQSYHLVCAARLWSTES